MTQLSISFEGNKLRDEGIQRAVSHANAVLPGWSERALDLLKNFMISHQGPFMVEEVRSYAALVDFPLPPHARSWGGIIKRAEKEGLVKHVTYSATKNAKAHRTPASVWIKI